MDRFDRIAIGAVVVLLAVTVAVVLGHNGEAKADRNLHQRMPAAGPVVANDELDNGLRLARNLIEAGNLPQAEALVSELKRKFPYQGEVPMLMGDLFMRKQDPLKAMHEYQQAIDLNPDFLDKKTPLFQGKKLKTAVGEAQTELENRLRLDPANASLKSEKKAIYYLYRKIAGSCG
jgi:tetratricopeptide (TPR) repeat protein